MSNIELVKMKSLLPLTEYAPTWDFSIGFKQWQDPDKIAAIRNFLLFKEPILINQYQSNNDGGTSLGLNSVTSRFGNYNLFDLIPECPELGDLLTFFRTSYLDFVSEDRTNIKNLNIVCWYNVVRNSQKITIHNHNSSNDAYLSGNMHLGEYDTVTVYRNPYDVTINEPFPNKEGGLTIFPSCLPHYATQYEGDQTRISIAFDLWIEWGDADSIDITQINPNKVGTHLYANWQKQKSLKAIPFMSPKIFQQLLTQQEKITNDVYPS